MSEPITLPRLRPYARQGKAYYNELRALLKEIGDDLLSDAQAIRAEAGKFVVRDLCVLALKHELNLKATAEYLEDRHFIPCGSYDRILNGGIRPMTALRETWAEMQKEGQQR